VGPTRVDPRHPRRDVAWPRSGRERDCVYAKVAKARENLDLVPSDAARHRLEQLTAVKGDLHRATRW
jgi:hypothetical protein